MKMVDIERNFRNIGQEIDKQILSGGNISDSIYLKYKEEYIKLKKEYKSQNSNLNFITYNYYIRKPYQKGVNFKNKLEYTLIALYSYLNLNVKKTDTFSFKLKKAIEMLKIVNYNEAIQMMNRTISMMEYIKVNQKKIKQDATEILLFYQEQLNIYFKKISVDDRNQNEETEKLSNKMIELFNILQKYKRDTKVSMLLSQNIYLLNKKKSIYMVRFLYFETNQEYLMNVFEKLKQSIENMNKYSQFSLKIANKIYKEIDDNDKIKVMLVLKQIDVDMATYFKLLYSEKNTNGAWKKINSMKQFIVHKIFNEGITISESLMKNINEEWNLLQAFNKVSILKNEIVKLANNSETKWIKDTLNDINIAFENIEKLFKYDENKSNVTRLENIDDSFSGTLIEYLLYDLIKSIKVNNSLLKKIINEKYNELITQIQTSCNIELNRIILSNKPDIDINIADKTAILIKNAKIKDSEYKTINQELQIVSDILKYKECYYLINFNKNIDNIIELKENFEKFEEKYNLVIKVIDIKEFYSNLLNCLKEPKKRYNFSDEQLYKLLGY